MESDLTAIQLFMAKKDDIVIVDKIPSDRYLDKLQNIAVEIPAFILKKDIAKPSVTRIPKNRLLPWGWSPAAHKLLEPLKESCSEEFKLSPVFNWKTEYREIYSKKFALDILQKFISGINSNSLYLPEKLIPEVCTTKTEIEALLQKWDKIMVKAPWSSSGRGLQPVTKTPVHTKVWEKILGIINDQGCVITESFLNKILDFSFQFKIINGKIEFLGISIFIADKKGQYQGNYLNGLPQNIGSEIVEFQKKAISEILDPLVNILESSELAKNYEGNFGVDTLVFSDENNNLKINPCLEINIRQNMGLLSLHLEKLIAPKKKGIYRMFYEPETTFKQFTLEMEKKFPLVISVQKKIESGFVALTEDLNDTLFGSYLLV